MRRRTFLQTAAVGLGLSAQRLPLVYSAAAVPAAHHVAQVVAHAERTVPEGKRAPFGWTLATVVAAREQPLLLAWPDLPANAQPTHFRIAIGLDERDEKKAEVFLPKSGDVLGVLDIRFASQFQVFELALQPADITKIRREGIALRLTAGSDLEVLTGGPNIPAALQPHLLVPGEAQPTAEFLARLNSLACVQQFGWMEGCVLDGLLDLAEQPAHAPLRAMARKHLALFVQGERLVYEGPTSSPSDGKVYGIEGSLPFAALARLQPEHPLHDIAIKFWRSRKRENGSVQDGDQLTSEGAYTVGYALAEIAHARRSEELFDLALAQVRVRQKALFDGKEFWRTRRDNGQRGNRNWARGIAWQILGLTRTLAVAKQIKGADELVPELQSFAAWALKLQREDGLWSVFADDPKLTPDTAGSAGIAAALAIGVKHGWLDTAAKRAATQAFAGLTKHLTADGFLAGVSQSNKGGEGLQRSNYRAIFQMGMGLQAQLMAALG